MVNLLNCDIKQLFEKANNRKIYLFGCSKALKTRCIIRTPDYDVCDIAYKIVDNDSSKWGTKYYQAGNLLDIISLQELIKEIEETAIIVISSMYYGEILEQLDAYQELDGIECYILKYIDDYFDSKIDKLEVLRAKNEEYYIPPIIHYCWFGKKKIPDQYLEYIETWRKYCPDYEIIEWNENNYDVRKNSFLKWAYENEKWAFVSDYARLDVVYQQGGIYLDTDVELIKNLDELRKFHAFMGYESTQMVASGLGFGAEKGNLFVLEMRDYYDGLSSVEERQLPCTVHQTNILRKYGLEVDNSFQSLANNKMVILPTEFLCGVRMNSLERQITENTYALHHYCGDWGGKSESEQNKRLKKEYAIKIRERIGLSVCPTDMMRIKI